MSDVETGAVLSDDGLYRYKLTRRWDDSKPTIAFVMLNPSTADDVENDPTIRRCLGYARDWGYGSLVVANLFAYRTSDPPELREVEKPIGPENDEYLLRVCEEADKVIAAWGTDGTYLDRESEAADLLSEHDLYAIDTSKYGHPNHPLYLPKDAEPTLWEA